MLVFSGKCGRKSPAPITMVQKYFLESEIVFWKTNSLSRK
jgi:hypothetical protein